ncbi:MAG: hypothetical protein DHS20C15_11800 [Planctomycetota bacterium]|nr:MAG: hypothetical protein DHS20C15_11800 [Planctomycetota bacterium]
MIFRGAGPDQASPEQLATFHDARREFAAKWPIERLREMSLDDYCHGDESLSYDLERRFPMLGGIKGGSAFKFGIYERIQTEKREPDSAHIWGDTHGWYRRNGDTREAAWKTVHEALLATAEAAAEGRYEDIDAIEFGDAIKWKLALIYQSLDKPGVIPVFKKSGLVRACERLLGRADLKKAEFSSIYRALLDGLPTNDIAQAGRSVWRAIQEGDETEEVDVGSSDASEPQPATAFQAPRNQILYGPPGTGKTYSVFRQAVKICDGSADDDSSIVNERFHELRRAGRIEFVTFHQSYSYEDFVEGLRPVLDDEQDGAVRYEIREGVFRTICRSAQGSSSLAAAGPKRSGSSVGDAAVWKMSLGRAHDEQSVFDDCIANSIIRLGYGGDVDYADADTREKVAKSAASGHDASMSPYVVTSVHALRNTMAIGDIVVVSDGNLRFRAIGRITGEYEYRPDDDAWGHVRPVEWLRVFDPSQPYQSLLDKRFSQVTLYNLGRVVRRDALQGLINGPTTSGPLPHVLIIDEINRGNIAKIFGELITLLEEDKRIGAENELFVRLPQSGDAFGVPSNLFLIGTMNTADRSIAFLDAALRRRFRFSELMPDSNIVRDEVGLHAGSELASLAADLLDAMNDRIELLFDRDHQIGHAYLLRVASLEGLRTVLLHRIIPLLQEYFLGDWGKVSLVLGLPDPSERRGTPEHSVLDFLGAPQSIGDVEPMPRVAISKRFNAAQGEDLKPWFEQIIRGHS